MFSTCVVTGNGTRIHEHGPRINVFNIEVAAKRLELLRELVPATTRVAVLVNPAEATTAKSTLRDLEPAARAMGLQIELLNASTSREIDAAFATFGASGLTHFSSPPDLFLPSGGCSSPSWRRAMRFP